MPATPSWPPRSAPRLFVSQQLGEGVQVSLDGSQAHYLMRVMRMGQGDIVILCDNVSGEWAARVTEAGKRNCVLEAVELLRPREAVPDFWLCPALLKKDRFDLVLEKACELGAARLQPVITRRCVADKLNPERALAIVTEAAEQCARTALPELAPPLKLDALLAGWPEDRTLFFADEMGGAPAADAFARQRAQALAEQTSPKAALIIGPEGGFDDAERDHIRALPQSVPISLGPRILRGETAAMAAIAVWMAIAGDWH